MVFVVVVVVVVLVVELVIGTSTGEVVVDTAAWHKLVVVPP